MNAKQRRKARRAWDRSLEPWDGGPLVIDRPRAIIIEVQAGFACSVCGKPGALFCDEHTPF